MGGVGARRETFPEGDAAFPPPAQNAVPSKIAVVMIQAHAFVVPRIVASPVPNSARFIASADSCINGPPRKPPSRLLAYHEMRAGASSDQPEQRPARRSFIGRWEHNSPRS